MKYRASQIGPSAAASFAACLVPVLLASCTTAPDPGYEMSGPAYSGAASMQVAGSSNLASAYAGSGGLVQAPSSGGNLVQAEPSAQTQLVAAADQPSGPVPDLPEEMAIVPTPNPLASRAAVAAFAAPAAVSQPALGAPPMTLDAAAAALEPPQAFVAETPVEAVPDLAPVPALRPNVPGLDPQAIGSVQTAAIDQQALENPGSLAAPEPQASPRPAPAQKAFAPLSSRGESAGLMPRARASSTTPIEQTARPLIADDGTAPLIVQQKPSNLAQAKALAKPIVDLGQPTQDAPTRLASLEPAQGALPGVRQSTLFEIRKPNGHDDSDIDVNEEDAPIRTAMAAGMARLAPNGLLTQTDRVDVACLKPSLVRVLQTVKDHFHSTVMVTSGFRNLDHNREARGAKNSLHMFCAAADIQVEGVAKAQLADYLRTMPGRGGVGTYCYTDSVHVDIGPERDWNWRCRRRG